MYQAALTGTAQHFIQSFSWMLIHSLWQGLLLAVVTAVILMLTKRTRATVRYNLVFVQFALFLLACGITFVYEWNKSPKLSVAPGITDVKADSSISLVNINLAGLVHFARICIDYFTANAPLIVLLWFVVFLFRAVRMMGSLVYIHRAKHRMVYQPSEEWKARVTLLCQKLQLKKAVKLLESGCVKMPMVIGHLKPMILVPVGMLAGLPAGQVEAVLLHELAHIRRNDYVINFLQTIAETVFFFNPGLLWISSLLRDERENCCDDIALKQTKNKREFIEALISFKEHSLYGAKYEVAFPGKKNHLLNRVSRILNNKNKALAPAEKGFFIAGVIALSIMVTTAAIAEVHTTIANHKKPVPAVVTSLPVRAVAPTRPIYSADDKPARQALHLRQSSPTAHSASRATSHTANLDDALKNMRDKLRTDKDAYSTIVGGQRQKVKKLSDQDQARLDQIQAVKDQEKARRDQAQAIIDQEDARNDQEQAMKDQAQVRIDQEQGKKDREDATQQQQTDKQHRDADELQAKRNAEQAKRNQAQNVRNQEQVQLNAEQQKRNAEQAIRNQQQAEQNKMQAKLNEQQAKTNAEQNIRNQEQAKKNQASIQE